MRSGSNIDSHLSLLQWKTHTFRACWHPTKPNEASITASGYENKIRPFLLASKHEKHGGPTALQECACLEMWRNTDLACHIMVTLITNAQREITNESTSHSDKLKQHYLPGLEFLKKLSTKLNIFCFHNGSNYRNVNLMQDPGKRWMTLQKLYMNLSAFCPLLHIGTIRSPYVFNR